MTDPVTVDIVSDVVCPWCAIGYYQLAKASEVTGVTLDVRWRPFELNPRMPLEGENLREHLAAKYGTTPESSRAARARLTELGAAVGFAFDYADDMRMWNTFRAHQLARWADEQGQGHAMQLLLFKAYFTCRRDISDIDLLASLADDLGFDAAAAEDALVTRAMADAVRAEETEWVRRGFHGVPAMLFEGRKLASGAQGVERYARLLRWLAPKSGQQAFAIRAKLNVGNA